jgi:hypothetical protein
MPECGKKVEHCGNSVEAAVQVVLSIMAVPDRSIAFFSSSCT